MEITNPDSPWAPYVWVDPDRMGGEPCFRGSRVPIRSLFDYLESGQSIGEFLDDFPPVTREQAGAVLRLAVRTLIEAAAA